MPALSELLNTVTLGDSLEVLKTLPDQCVDLILTDPPYGKKADKGTNGFGCAKNNRYVAEWDSERPSAEFFGEILRVSKKAIIFGGNYFADRLPTSPCWLVWDKVGEFHFSSPFSDVELAWTNFSRAAKKYTVIQHGFIKDDRAERIHPTQKPEALFLAILQDFASPGQIILDPFSGSGTTAIACHRLGLDFVAIERDPGYHAASLARLNAERAQLLLNI